MLAKHSRFRKLLSRTRRLVSRAISDRDRLWRATDSMDAVADASAYTLDYQDKPSGKSPQPERDNPLWDYFQAHREGPGVWKFNHYFDIYHRHFAKFVGQQVNVLEIGIYSGGSLEMWRDYFGDQSHIYGIDIEEDCKVYQSEHVSIVIGDQEDRSFWQGFLGDAAGGLDIIIDDDGHTPEQQRVTLEELLPRLNAGGVYLCEDIHGGRNDFATYASALVHALNETHRKPGDQLRNSVTPWQAAVYSICFYPFVLVIEKTPEPVTEFAAPKHGTQWQPFLGEKFVAADAAE